MEVGHAQEEWERILSLAQVCFQPGSSFSICDAHTPAAAGEAMLDYEFRS